MEKNHLDAHSSNHEHNAIISITPAHAIEKNANLFEYKLHYATIVCALKTDLHILRLKTHFCSVVVAFKSQIRFPLSTVLYKHSFYFCDGGKVIIKGYFMLN